MPTIDGFSVYTLARQQGLSVEQAKIATAIAKGESGFRTDARGDTTITDATWGPSIGLWQIRSLNAQKGTGGHRDELANTDPVHNAKAMAAISLGGTNWRPWTIYTNGAYKNHLNAYKETGGKSIGVDDLDDIAVDVATNPGDALGAVGDVVDYLNPLDDAFDGLKAIGAFFARLLDPALWLRVMQILGGVMLIGGGVLVLNRDLVAQAASAAVPIP